MSTLSPDIADKTIQQVADTKGIYLLYRDIWCKINRPTLQKIWDYCSRSLISYNMSLLIMHNSNSNDGYSAYNYWTKESIYRYNGSNYTCKPGHYSEQIYRFFESFIFNVELNSEIRGDHMYTKNFDIFFDPKISFDQFCYDTFENFYIENEMDTYIPKEPAIIYSKLFAAYFEWTPNDDHRKYMFKIKQSRSKPICGGTPIYYEVDKSNPEFDDEVKIERIKKFIEDLINIKIR